MLHVLVILLGVLFSCGSETQPRTEARIIGGEVARSGQFPFAAAIYTTTADGTYFCGGTLLNNEWILTAGQCVNGAVSFTILLGTNHLNSNDSYTVRVSTNSYVLHPDYESSTLDNDIGLIHLRIPIEYNDYLQPVDVLPFGMMGDYSYAEIIGWGRISDDESGLADELRVAQVVSLSNSECKLIYGNQITDSMVCVGGSFNEGTCLGDSGSPLIDTYVGQYRALTAVSSFYSGNGCESTDPSGFTRIYQYNAWIRDITGFIDRYP